MRVRFKKNCRKARQTAWRKFTFQLDKTDKMASLAKTLQKKEKSKLYTLRKHNGTMTEPGKETLDLLFQTHFPASTPLKKVQYQSVRFANIQSKSSQIRARYLDWIYLHTLNKVQGGSILASKK